MGYRRTTTVETTGLACTVHTLEADIGDRTGPVHFTGLPESVANQLHTRVRSAMANSALRFPNKAIHVNLSPESSGLTGTFADLAVAVAVIGAAENVDPLRLAECVLIAELGLDGSLRPVRGIWPALTAARDHGARTAIVAPANAAEAALVDDIAILAPASLADCHAWLHGQIELDIARPVAPDTPQATPDLADLPFTAEARFALEVAAAGGHHMLLVGPPGAAKTALAERLPSLLPPLNDTEALEVTSMHSLGGCFTGEAAELIRSAPFTAPHHSSTVQTLIGGGAGPGAVALAHRGVLFLDEAPEWNQRVLGSLLRVLDTGEVYLRRSDTEIRYPARTQLVAAANPCPCGPARDAACACTPGARQRYRARLTRPLLDRIDLRLELPALQTAAPAPASAMGEPSRTVAGRVSRARQVAAARWTAAGVGPLLGRDVPGPVLRATPWRLPSRTTAVAERLLATERITLRGFDRILRLAWTIADLDRHERPTAEDVGAACELRLGTSLSL
jgi:magnesium chelatase family protein